MHDVGQKLDQNEDRDRQQEQHLHHRVIPPTDSLLDQLADARPGKDRLNQYGLRREGARSEFRAR